MKPPWFGSGGGEAESRDLSGDLIVQLGAATEELNRTWDERNHQPTVRRCPIVKHSAITWSGHSPPCRHQPEPWTRANVLIKVWASCWTVMRVRELVCSLFPGGRSPGCGKCCQWA